MECLWRHVCPFYRPFKTTDTHTLNPGVPTPHAYSSTRIPGLVGVATLMNDALATNLAAIASPKYTHHQHIGVRMLESTIAAIACSRVPEGFR